MNFKLNKTLVIWLVIIASVLILGIQASLYFRVAKVPVLTKDVPAGKQITKDMVKLIDVNPSSEFLANSITNINDLFRDGNPNGNNGKYVLVPLFKGQVIDKRALTDSLTDTAFGIGAQVEDNNHVAISILIPIQNAVGVNLSAGQKLNLTYALGQGQATLGQSISIDKNTLKEIKGVQLLDVRNENGVKVLSGNVPTGKNVMLILSIPSSEAPNISLAASGQGIIYLTLPSTSTQLQMPSSVSSGGAAVTPESQVPSSTVPKSENATPTQNATTTP